jgi:hypothetical protein
MADPSAPQPPQDNTKMGKSLAAQSRDSVKDQDRKRTDFASGKKRFTEGK